MFEDIYDHDEPNCAGYGYDVIFHDGFRSKVVNILEMIGALSEFLTTSLEVRKFMSPTDWNSKNIVINASNDTRLPLVPHFSLVHGRSLMHWRVYRRNDFILHLADNVWKICKPMFSCENLGRMFKEVENDPIRCVDFDLKTPIKIVFRLSMNESVQREENYTAYNNSGFMHVTLHPLYQEFFGDIAEILTDKIEELEKSIGETPQPKRKATDIIGSKFECVHTEGPNPVWTATMNVPF